MPTGKRQGGGARRANALEPAMRILDQDRDIEVTSATIYLTTSEAEELYSQLADLIAEGKNVHFHLNSDDFAREITICHYVEGGENRLLAARSQRILAGQG